VRESLRRLATTGAAYGAGAVAQKVVAVALLPLYTRYLSPADYGAAEVLLQTTLGLVLLVRFGLIEAVFRFYFQVEEPHLRQQLVRAAMYFVAAAGGVCATILVLVSGPLSEALLGRHDPALVRIAAIGLWTLSVGELLMATFRVEERPRAYLAASFASLLASAAATTWLVVGLDMGAEGLLLGNFAGSAVVLVGVGFAQRQYVFGPAGGMLRPMLSFGAPTVPGEVSLYAINIVDRVAVARLAGLAEAGLYALAMKLSQGVMLLGQGFRLAWAPLAYSVTDDEQARALYARVITYLALAGTTVTLITSLEAPWIARLLATPSFYEAHEAVALLSLAVTLNTLYLALLVAMGRAHRTRATIGPALAGTGANFLLLVLLVPPFGFVGAAAAAVGCYLVMLPLLYLSVRRVFPLPLEWRRLGLIALLGGVAFAGGSVGIPEHGTLAFCARAFLVGAFLVALRLCGFFEPRELEHVRGLARGYRRAAVCPEAASSAKSRP
jgi:O-antigen/teichoic acid export membrane protein